MNIHRLYSAISPLFRRKRMKRFRQALTPCAGENILDVGGMPEFWSESEIAPRVTVLNVDPSLTPTETSTANQIASVTGDGCALAFADGSFDVVFSNSVIEHVGTWERQQAFASECRRVGRRLWVQTPAREFFIEPHLLAPFVHWLPRQMQRRLIRNFTVRGWIERPGPRDVEAFLDEVRLITHAEMRTLFPDCTILRERFFGSTKSYIAVRTAST
jgi:ubiquinone/menaquinone biosynthesis C-methylase UbiE